MSPRLGLGRSVSPGNGPVASHPNSRRPKPAAAAAAVEPIALCPPSANEVRSDDLVLRHAPSQEQLPEAVPADAVPETLLQQLRQQAQPQTPQQHPHHQQQLRQKKQGHGQIQGAKDRLKSAATPRTTHQEILSMPLSELVQISAETKASAEPSRPRC